MNILYTSNRTFLPKVAASLCSVLENNSDVDELEVYIMENDFTDEDRQKLQKLAVAYNRNIHIISIGDIEEALGFSLESCAWNLMTMARLMIDRFLPINVKRILYIDGDTIVRSSLQELWNTDLQGNVLGACIEATVAKGTREKLLGVDWPYINSGVLLIDLKMWKLASAGQKILDYCYSNKDNPGAPDQDAINAVLKGLIYYLPPKYNFSNIYWFYNYRVLKKLMGDVPYYSKEIYDDSVKNPVIIHYMGEDRPWRSGNHHKFRNEWWQYLRKTPWGGGCS